MQNIELLKRIGLDDKESAVYLALLELGLSSVYGIARKANLKRPTTYLILDNLEKKGLVSLVPQHKVSLYVAQSPEKLLTDLMTKERLLKEQLPALLAIHNANKEKPNMQVFQGKEAVGDVYQKILSAKHVRFFATVRDVAVMYPDFIKQLVKKTNAGEITVKEILTKNSEDTAYAGITVQSECYEQRFSSLNPGFETDNVIFDDTVVFFSYSPYVYAVMISSNGITQSLTTLFDLAWQSAELYEKVVGTKD